MKKVIGYILFVASFIAWAAIAVLPFLNLSIEMGAAITTGLIVGGEIVFFLIVKNRVFIFNGIEPCAPQSQILFECSAKTRYIQSSSNGTIKDKGAMRLCLSKSIY
jgi:hypothetical protein